MRKRTKHRESWGSRIGVILAAAGSAVGLGNFLRFPGVVATNGGGAFMIPYILSFLFLALPLCWMEWTLGRFGGRFGHGSAPGIFDAVTAHRRPALKYFGILGVAGAMGIFFYYIVIEAWTLAYTCFSLFGVYDRVATPDAMSSFFASFLSGDGTYFSSRLPLYGFFLITFVANIAILYHGISKGIERFCRYAMPLLFVLAVILVVRVFTLGAPENPAWNLDAALGFLWNPDFEKLKDAKVWLAAAGQVFFSTSVGIGILLTYASYIKSRENIVLPSTAASFLNEFAEIVLGASIVIPAAFLFFGPQGTVAAVEGGTFGLAFKTTPLIFQQMACGGFIGFLWFTLLFIAGVTSAVSVLQPAVAFLEDEFHLPRKKSLSILSCVTFLAAHLVIFGDGVLGEMDFWFCTFGLPMFALFETFVFLRYLGIRRGWAALTRGSTFHVPEAFRFIMAWVTPCLLTAVIIGWFVTEGWKTILMMDYVDGAWHALYPPHQMPWIIAVRVLYVALLVTTGVMIHYAFATPRTSSASTTKR